VNEPRDLLTDPAPDGIDEGRRLIRLGGDKGLSLADRLAERFHRLTWRTPLHTLRLKGRYPLKLIAVPEDPILGDIARGTLLLEGVLSFRGEARDIETLDLAKPLPPNPSPNTSTVSRGYAICRPSQPARAAPRSPNTSWASG
jgi:hypothetical protein